MKLSFRAVLTALMFLTILLAVPTVFAAQPAAGGQPTLSGAFSLGGAISELPFQHPFDTVASCPAAQFDVRVSNLIGPISFTGQVRHFITDDQRSSLYWRSKFVTGLEVPVSPTAILFCSYEDNYHKGAAGQWCWGGIRFKFGRS